MARDFKEQVDEDGNSITAEMQINPLFTPEYCQALTEEEDPDSIPDDMIPFSMERHFSNPQNRDLIRFRTGYHPNIVKQRKNNLTGVKPKLNKQMRELFLARLPEFRGNQNATIKSMGISKSTLSQYKTKNPGFVKKIEGVLDDLNESIKAEIYRRGVEGVQDVQTYQGKIMKDEDGNAIEKTIYSDALLISLAKARFPEFQQNTNIKLEGEITTTDSSNSKEKLLSLLGVSAESLLEGSCEDITDQNALEDNTEE